MGKAVNESIGFKLIFFDWLEFIFNGTLSVFSLVMTHDDCYIAGWLRFDTSIYRSFSFAENIYKKRMYLDTIISVMPNYLI